MIKCVRLFARKRQMKNVVMTFLEVRKFMTACT